MKLFCTTPNRPLPTSKFYVDFKKIFSKGPKNDTHLLFSMFCSLSGISLSWKTLVFGRFTSQERTNVYRTAFFLHSPDFSLSKVAALKVVWGKWPSLVFLGVVAILQMWATSSYIQIWLWPGLVHCSSSQGQIEAKLQHNFAGASCNILLFQ